MGRRTTASPNRSTKIGLDEVLSHLSDAMNVNELMIVAKQQTHAPASSSSSTSARRLAGNYNLHGTFRRENEVMPDIVLHEEQGSEERPPAFGEAMLENFGFHNTLNLGSQGCGGVEGESQPLLDSVIEPREWMQIHYDLDVAQQQQQLALLGSSMSAFGDVSVDRGLTESKQMLMPVVSTAMVKPNASDLQAAMETNRSDENIDKSSERRQKRMIKNRESAARSRAKKQAHINQLEEQVKQLTMTNKWLKKQKEEATLPCFTATLEPRHQLRRNSSF